MVETPYSNQPNPDNAGTPGAVWPLVLVALYVATLFVAAVGELFEIPAILNFFLFR